MQNDVGAIFVSVNGPGKFVRTAWGEEAWVRQSRKSSGGRLCVMEYRAPTGFGPPRHLHRADDETLLIKKGSVVLWSPDGFTRADPGDIFFLPRSKPHTWRCIGPDHLELTLFVSPGEFEPFFPTLAEKGLTLSDIDQISDVTLASGMDLVGPPLTEAEIMSFLEGSG